MKTKLIQMRLLEKTTNKVEDIKKITGEENRTKIVSQAISVYLEVLKFQKDGKTIRAGDSEIIIIT